MDCLIVLDHPTEYLDNWKTYPGTAALHGSKFWKAEGACFFAIPQGVALEGLVAIVRSCDIVPDPDVCFVLGHAGGDWQGLRRTLANSWPLAEVLGSAFSHGSSPWHKAVVEWCMAPTAAGLSGLLAHWRPLARAERSRESLLRRLLGADLALQAMALGAAALNEVLRIAREEGFAERHPDAVDLVGLRQLLAECREAVTGIAEPNVVPFGLEPIGLNFGGRTFDLDCLPHQGEYSGLLAALDRLLGSSPAASDPLPPTSVFAFSVAVERIIETSPGPATGPTAQELASGWWPKSPFQGETLIDLDDKGVFSVQLPGESEPRSICCFHDWYVTFADALDLLLSAIRQAQKVPPSA